MRIRGFLPAGFLLFLSIRLLAPAPSGFPGETFGQDRPERPKFYALRVVSENKVQNAKDSLGAPDGRYAEILPGGQIVLRMEEALHYFPGPGGPGEEQVPVDSGSVVGKGGADFALEGWFKWQDMEGEQRCDWMVLGVSSSGFFLPLLSSILSSDVSADTDMVRISNIGNKALFVDAVIGYSKDTVTDGSYPLI